MKPSQVFSLDFAGNKIKNLVANHDFFATEQDPNARAFKYFNKNVDGFYDVNRDDNKGWDFGGNPLDVNGTRSRLNIIDYHNESQFNSLNSLHLKPHWYDYAAGIGFPGWTFLFGSVNFINFNN